MKIIRLFFQLVRGRFFRKEKRRFILLSLLLTLLLLFIVLLFARDFGTNKPIKWGVTFSKRYAIELNMNWQEVFVEILYDLGAKRIRIPVYWDDVERTQGEYNFQDYDWMVRAADLVDAEVVLVLGRRQPRWPECFTPAWTDNLADSEVEEKILNLVEEEVNHFKQYKNIVSWQVENEPLLSIFGECPPPNKDFLEKEVALVKSLDSRPIILTDSGELGSWSGVAGISDTIGTTMYRVVWNRSLGYIVFWWQF